MDKTKIAWTTSTLNQWTGCTAVDHECRNCYAEELIDGRYGANGAKRWGQNATRLLTSEATRKKPYSWNRDAALLGRPWFVFCGSLMDVMDPHQSIQQSWRDELFKTITETTHLTWLLLTKRPERYTEVLAGRQLKWPHVWLGTTAGHSDDKALQRIKALQGTEIHPKAQRFISAEPLLTDMSEVDLSGIGWVIAGGESGNKARPFHLAHALDLYRNCDRQGVKFFLKQVGAVTMDGERQLELTGSLHDLSVVPDGYAEMIRRDRPEPCKCDAEVKPQPKRVKKLKERDALPALEPDSAITPQHMTAIDASAQQRLSQWLERQFPSEEVSAAEAKLRPQLMTALNTLRRSRYEIGRLLVEYRKLFGGTFNGLLAALSIKRSTGFEIIADYERAKAVPEPVRAAAAMRGIDLAEKKHKALAFGLQADVNGVSDEQVQKIVDDAISADAERKAEAKPAPAKPELVQIQSPVQTLEAKAREKLGAEEYDRRLKLFLEELLRNGDAVAA